MAIHEGCEISSSDHTVTMSIKAPQRSYRICWAAVHLMLAKLNSESRASSKLSYSGNE